MKPALSEIARNKISEEYARLRLILISRNNKRAIPITTRTVETLIRLSY